MPIGTTYQDYHVFDSKDLNSSILYLSDIKEFLIPERLKKLKHNEIWTRGFTDLELTSEDYIFFSLHNPDNNLDRVEAWRMLKKAADKVGIENFGTHSMRKTLAWTIYKQTKDISLVMIMLNHNSPKTTLRYLGITQESIDKTYEEFAI